MGRSAKLKAGAILRQYWAAEQGRFILWIPVLLIVGISGYFTLPVEPALWQSIGGAAASAGLVGATRWWPLRWARGLTHAIVIVTAGFLLAFIRTQSVYEPAMPHETVRVRIEGELLKVEDRPRAQRFLIAPSKIGGLAPENLPARIRLVWRGEASTARPGDIVGLYGVVAPPPSPTLPGGYDYGRQLYFERIGGVGFAVSKPHPVWRPHERRLTNKIEDWRKRIAARIMDKASPSAGPVLAAVVTGLRAQVPEETTWQLRDTGLAHLLAISGLHMGLVCGFLFIGLRRILLWSPGRLGAVFPIKKWAAFGALAGGVIYLILSGGAWSAQRAFITASISFIAILLDRRAISLRNVAIAAIIIMCLKPEAVLAAGFQMSFGAVMALVAAYEAWEQWRRKHPHTFHSPRLLRFIGGVVFTSFVAGMATSPFAVYHFGRIANYGLLANLAVMPLFSAGVMPIAVFGLMAMAVGLDAPFWWLASKAFDLLLRITDHIADWPGAVLLVPHWPTAAWLVLVGSMIVLCLSAAPWRILGVAGLPLALTLAAVQPPPLLMVAEGARNIAWQDPETGAVQLLNRQKARFATKTWLEAFGRPPDRKAVESFGPCKDQICSFESPAGRIVFTEDAKLALAQCEAAALIITSAWIEHKEDVPCTRDLYSADRLAKTGPVLVRQQGGRLLISSVKARRGRRPWAQGPMTYPTGTGF
ncbi:MAG: ComEC/Rec2 family competence protein [Parvularcula sp.]